MTTPEYRQQNGKWSYSITERVDGKWVKSGMSGFDSKDEAVKAYESKQRRDILKDEQDDEDSQPL